LNCKLVFDDWRQFVVPYSIYNTQLGLDLSSGDLHSGTTFSAVVRLPEKIEQEIKDAYEEHGAYPVFRLIPIAGGGAR
jgi:hypothetical protein